VSELTLAGLSERIGSELGVSDWVVIDQERIDIFASCTGDRQWIHVDPERAKRESPFRGPIAHGYLTLAMVAPLAMQIGVIPKDAAAGLNYGIDKVRFLAPVPAGARVRLRVVLAGVEPRDGGQVIVLSNSGHLQSLLNPPTNPKASFTIGSVNPAGPDAFLSEAEKRKGSWWLDWRDWLHARSGEEIVAPTSLGSARHPVIASAPGTYVFD